MLELCARQLLAADLRNRNPLACAVDSGSDTKTVST
jgi:hypothetical protein